MKKTVLVVLAHYLPGTKTGGPVRSVSNLVEELGDVFNFRILTYNHDSGESEPYPGVESGKWYRVGKAQVRYLTPSETQLFRLRDIINSTPHDILHLESILARTSIQALVLHRLGMLPDTPIVLTPRGHLGQGALQQKSAKKAYFLRAVKAIRLYRDLNWYATSQSEKDEIIQHFGQQEASRIRVLPNLTTRTAPALEATRPPKRIGYVRMAFLSRISRKKNLHFAFELLRELDAEVEFDIYGHLEDSEYWQECQTIIDQLPPQITVHYLGAVDFDQVTTTLSGYHLFFLPTLHENFGHVILEALCAGCVLLISDQTPWRNLSERGAGWDLPLQPERFVQALQTFAALDQDNFLMMSAAALQMGRSFVEDRGNVENTKAFFDDILRFGTAEQHSPK